MNKIVSIIDYGMGNLLNVKRACEQVGIQVKISNDKREIISSSAVILPGVGAFADAMKNLEDLDLIDTIKEFIQQGKYFMGICLGMQLLFDSSEEFGFNKGLSIVKGKVVKFPIKDDKGYNLRIPQINWNKIYHENSSFDQYSILKEVKNNESFYFLHSYYVIPDNKNNILCNTVYNGIEYCSGLKKDNVIALQFHPEKSGKSGLNVLNNFKKML